jgi:ribosomal protein S18 acetylase RimI-like enzyme
VPSDAESLAALAIQVWLHTYATEGISPSIARYVLSEFTAEKFVCLLSREDTAVLVAEAGGNLVGYAVVSIGAECPSANPTTANSTAANSAAANSTAELATLYVQEHFAQAGIGSALLAESRGLARRRGGSVDLWLTVNVRNEPAIAFYRKHGFIRIGLDYFELDGQRHENHVLVGPGM